MNTQAIRKCVGRGWFFSDDGKLVIQYQRHSKAYALLRFLWRLTGGHVEFTRVGVNTASFVVFIR